jgi:Co/Zn/Cd efflux system component
MDRLKAKHNIEIVKGLFIGLTIPFISYAILLLVNEKISALIFSDEIKDNLLLDNKTVAILAICVNLIPFHLSDKRRQTKAMRGILLSTFMLILLWLYVYGKEAMTYS